MIDTGSIRETTDLVGLAGTVTTLRRAAAREWAGPCPKCGGQDRLHVKSDYWFCRSCYSHDNGKPHDAIAWLMWLDGLTFTEACRRLDSGAVSAGPRPRVAPVVQKAPPAWTDATWQAEARHEAQAAANTLHGRGGESARAYLESRGLLPPTWLAWGLGAGLRWSVALQKEAPCIVIPWRAGPDVTALQYRFYGPDVDKGARFAQRKGGARVLFGMNLLEEHHTLILVEGEINALSLWQHAGGRGLDVVSFGAEAGASSAAARDLAAGYRRVFVWADQADKVTGAMHEIPGAFGLRSVDREGVKLDANALLQRRMLRDYLTAILDMGRA